MQINQDFTIEPFKRKPDFRSDKGKKHNYPKERKRWNPICLRKSNLILNQTSVKVTSMDTVPPRTFKHPPDVRAFMADAKRKQRANKASKQRQKDVLSENKEKSHATNS